jgi:hypothetical protein
MATIQIADNDARVQYTQAVTADTTQLTIDFPFFDLDDINVIVTATDGTDTTLSRGTGTGTFAVVGTSVDDGFSGGYVTLGDTYSNASTKYTIFRDVPVTRTTDFPTSGPFNISSLNTELDKIFAIEQELETKIGRTLKLADSDTAATLSLPNLDTRKGTVLAFNTTTGLPEAGPEIGDVSTIAAITTDISTLADIEDGTDATDAIQTVAGISSNVTTVAGISGNVTTVAGISSDVTAVADDATDIGTVATDISNVNTVAGISSNITTVAGISADVTAVADDAADIGAVAAVATEIGRLGTADAVADLAILGTADAVADMNTLGTAANVTNMDTLAGISANITTVAGISSDVTTVAGDAADIATVAADSADIQAVAADGTDIGLVAGQISPTNNISTVAGISSNITTVAGNNANITTVAGISSNVTTVAGISSDVTAVAGDATDIGTVATDLAGSDTIGTVAGSISNVNSVGTNIASVNTTAANITGVNSFADRYRVGASDPTTSLDEGDLAYNTTDNALKYYNGTSWASITAGLTDIVGDTTPQLGGNLDLNNSDITGTGDINITGTITGSGDLTIDTSTLHVDATNNRVGIGTASPSGLLNPHNASGDANVFITTGTTNSSTTILFGDSGSTDRGRVQYDHNNDSMRFNTAGSEAMRLDSSGNLGIGKTPSSKPLEIYKGSNPAIRIQNSTTGTTNSDGFLIEQNGSNTLLVNYESGHQAFYTGGSERVRIDSSGSLGVGVTNPGSYYATGLVVDGTNSNGITVSSGASDSVGLYFADGTSGDDRYRGYVQYEHTNNDLLLGTNGSERLRIKGDGTWGKAPAGTVLQVVQTHLNTTSSQSLSSNTVTNISGLNATITPKSTSSKILVMVRWGGELSITSTEYVVFGLKRGTTAIGNPAAAGSRPIGLAMLIPGYFSSDANSTPDHAIYQYMDSPSTTSATTYHATINSTNSSATLYNQRTVRDNNQIDDERITSTMILMEIAG